MLVLCFQYSCDKLIILIYNLFYAYMTAQDILMDGENVNERKEKGKEKDGELDPLEISIVIANEKNEEKEKPGKSNNNNTPSYVDALLQGSSNKVCSIITRIIEAKKYI